MPKGIPNIPRVIQTPVCHPERKYHCQGKCKSCYSREYAKDYRANLLVTTVTGMISKKRTDAKRNNVEFSITVEDISPLPLLCPVFGTPLDYTAGKGRGINGPTIDRVNPKVGYISGNVKVISKKANSLKNGCTITDVRAILKYMEENTTQETQT